MRSRLAAGLIVALAAACAPSTSSPSGTALIAVDPAAPAVELTIFAAASLKSALEAAADAYIAERDNVTLVLSTDSSSALEAKIEQGAPADVFLSADTTNPRKLFDGGWATELPTAFAANLLTVIVPTGNPGGLASPADLAKDGVDVIAAGEEVPITKYATQLLKNMGGLPGYPPEFEAAYAANVVSREENVKAVVAKIELGQGDAAIVYVTDAKASSGVVALDVPTDANVLATYAGVVVKASKAPEAAREFLTWFSGPEGRAILVRFGFQQPPG
ncbi:MAG TPA: molybdate ABC transporter substrate-binding protein [Candidatus Limnocylindria bacterium]|nr:molybdate ABC transporter substrate-binding protein [Candidatus Limnocylindria bacterium]